MQPEAPPSQAPPSAQPPPAPRKLQILLVEDHGDTARIIGRLLAIEGHAVAHAGDVATALDLVGREHFDLLLSDLGLPDGTGHDLMRQLRASGQMLPGIALSGYGMAADVQRSHAAGFSEHLTKPMSFQALLQAVHRVAAEEPSSPSNR
jgi:CheY-like chemotaxis protein